MKSLPHELLFTPEGSWRPEPIGISLSLSPPPLPPSLPSSSPPSLSPSLRLSPWNNWREHNQNQQLQGTKLIFAESELQPVFIFVQKQETVGLREQ